MGLRKKLVVVGGALGSVLIGSAAYAYWTSSGTDTGTATAGTSTAYLVDATVASTPLTPGGAAASVTINVTNQSAGAQQVNQIVLSVPAFSASANALKPACTEADFETVDPTTPFPWSLGSGATGTWAGSVKLKNSASNQDNCQGVTVTVTADVS